jgi:hypothetical protein
MAKEIDKELFDDGIIRLSTGRASSIELVEDSDDSDTYTIKFELMDVGTYNMFNFSYENLQFMVKDYEKDSIGVVSHGLDHSWKTLEQLGKVSDLELVGKGKSAKVIATSELFKETEAQKQAHILFRQGLLKFVSGGWFPTGMSWNEESNTIDLTDPKLREISSTPMPAKQDAKALEVLNSLNHSPKPITKKEDKPMENENPTEPSPEGKEVSEQVAKLTALETEHRAELEAIRKERAEMKATADNERRVSLLERAAELGLSEELFKEQSNDAIEVSLKAAKEMQVKLLKEREPVTHFGGEGSAGLSDGSPEMVNLLEKQFFGGFLYDEEA